MTRKKKIEAIVLAVAVVILAAWMAWGNAAIETTCVAVECEGLPESFAGLRIAHISDLHNTEFGRGSKRLLSILREEQPDLIVITGDLVDSFTPKPEISLAFAREAAAIAPCFYVTGNHESRLGRVFDEAERGLAEAGVTVLRNETFTLTRGGESIRIVGLDDPAFASGDDRSYARQQLAALAAPEGFDILLSHRPELFEVYAEAGVGLVFAGHAHGGQVRLPFIGGLVAPDQGLFPKYDAGVFTDGGTTMLVSRGLGNSIIPLRVNDRPQVIVAELTPAA